VRPTEARARHREEVLEIISRYPVRNPRIFGSVARGEETEESDVDILVEDGENLSPFDLASLELKLEALLGVKFDIRTPGDFSAAVAQRVSRDERRL